MREKRLLIVENGTGTGKDLYGKLSNNGYTVLLTEGGESSLFAFERSPFDLVISDMGSSDQEGFRLLEVIKRKSPQTPVIMVSRSGTVQHAVEAMRKGAFDFLLQPVPLEVLKERVRLAVREDAPATDVAVSGDLIGSMPIITRDRRMKDLIDLCDRIASSHAPVLIQGESGTGKELFAKYIHDRSPRHKGPFVAVNCASLPESLFESLLFGHEKGAFTGALCRKLGKFEMAHHGTLLLDEITEMSPFLQAKILRVLQEGELDRVGGRDPIPIDVRIIATSNRHVEGSVEKGEFREDLYFRLNVVSIQIPPLREREGDIELLAGYFLKKYSSDYGKPETTVSKEVLSWLSGQPWRGNVRELKNVIERAVLTGSKPALDLRDFSQGKEGLSLRVKKGDDLSSCSLKKMEQDLILKTLEKTNGNRTLAAKILGISIRTLRNKLHEYKETLSCPGIS